MIDVFFKERMRFLSLLVKPVKHVKCDREYTDCNIFKGIVAQFVFFAFCIFFSIEF